MIEVSLPAVERTTPSMELKILSRLLDYPQADVWANASLIGEHIQASTQFSQETKEGLLALLDSIVTQEDLDAQEQYSLLFDRGRAMSLLLFEHVHGDSRDRGQAMVDLMGVYQANGFDINARELPDYLPLFMEYLSQRPIAEVSEWVGETAHILGMLKARLEQRESPYEAIFSALLEWVPEKVDLAPLRDTASREERDDSPEAMDKIWEEEAINFGGGGVSGGCPTQQPPARSVSTVKWVDGAQLS